jgi:uncharacterized protein YggE
MKSTVTVTGFGQASAPADSMLVQLGVHGEGTDVATALDVAGEALPRVTAALRSAGVADRDMTTTGISVDERYDHQKNRQTGYVCRNQLRVVLRDLSGSGRLLRDVATAGGDALRIHSVSLQIVDGRDLAGAARAGAFADARRQAEQYAQLAGASLGQVLDVHDGAAPEARAYGSGAFGRSAVLYSAASSVPIEAGDLSEHASVTVRWELLR